MPSHSSLYGSSKSVPKLFGFKSITLVHTRSNEALFNAGQLTCVKLTPGK